tara:strand:- start:169 stop:396 length:228 start_codon:yes stop_codon:yes gene_type:complete
MINKQMMKKKIEMNGWIVITSLSRVLARQIAKRNTTVDKSIRLLMVQLNHSIMMLRYQNQDKLSHSISVLGLTMH